MYARYQPGTTTLGQRNVLAAAGTASPSQASRGKAVYYKASTRGTPPAAVRYGENAMMAEVKTVRTPTTVNGHGVVRRSRNQASPSHHRHRGHGHTTRHRSHHRGSSSGRSHHGGSDHSDSGSGYRTPSKGRRARPTQRLLYKVCCRRLRGRCRELPQPRLLPRFHFLDSPLSSCPSTISTAGAR